MSTFDSYKDNNVNSLINDPVSVKKNSTMITSDLKREEEKMGDSVSSDQGFLNTFFNSSS